MTVTTPAPAAAPAAGSSLTSVFVRLKLTLLRNGLRQSGGRTAAYIVTIVFGALFVAGTVLGFVLLRGHADAGTVAVLLVGVLALSWAVMPLFIPSGDETLDPSRLVMLPLRPRPLVRALLVASLVGVGPVLTLFLAVGAVLALAQGAAAVVFAVLAVPLVTLTCVALSRAVAAANIRLLTSRKGRDLALLSGVVIAVGMQFVNLGAQQLGRAGSLESLEPAAEVVGWLPPASAIGAVESAGRGEYAVAVARLLLTAAALAALVYWWQRSLVRLMVEPDGSTIGAASDAGREKSAGPGRLGGLLPEGRTGAVMERSLRYIWRDPKTKAAWVTSLAVGLILPLFNAFQGGGSLYFACFASFMLGIQMYNQFGQDTSAFWMVAQTIATKADAYAELRARALALLTVTLPYTVFVMVVTGAVIGDWTELAPALGMALALLGAMMASGAVASANFPYSIPQDSGYKNVAPGQGGLAWISIMGGMVVSALLCAPVIAFLIYLHVADLEGLLWLLLPAGALYGVLVGWAGLKVAAPRAARRLPEILAAVSKG
ncbi:MULTISPECIES: transporter [unclassified Streptomyces]|uniref:transporter n=1 Tax=unclassified Streptomyces TaxID=2593676 RepID=UPI0016603294|nr:MULTISPECIES: transporter [unclassified Streptomyces]MBD0707227.1 transporter [Streptomyces sp. CBMA291]MBD0713715.1 transporter [Streptomyces sp. CBMA370]